MKVCVVVVPSEKFKFSRMITTLATYRRWNFTFCSPVLESETAKQKANDRHVEEWKKYAGPSHSFT